MYNFSVIRKCISFYCKFKRLLLFISSIIPSTATLIMFRMYSFYCDFFFFLLYPVILRDYSLHSAQEFFLVVLKELLYLGCHIEPRSNTCTYPPYLLYKLSSHRTCSLDIQQFACYMKIKTKYSLP